MSSSASQETFFSLLPETRAPWTEFAFSTGTQAFAVAFLVWVRLLYPTVVSPPEHTFRSIQLVSAPVPVNHEPRLVRPLQKRTVVLLAHLNSRSSALRLPALHQKTPVRVEDDPAPMVSMALTKKLEPLPLSPAPVLPRQAVRTNVFSTGSSATPALARDASQLQTGGFGDPNGVSAKTNQGKAINVAALGSFDLPPGPGNGNGDSGTRGVPGMAVSSGFGNGTAIAGSRAHAARTVQLSGFADSDVPAAPAVRSQTADAASRAVPAEIIFKPTPAYTQEARSRRIEGEVLLEVVLQASGSLRVVRVVRGLGHGLDDNAVKAAEQIHFKPAMRDGQPTDSTVVLHIVFQLA